MWAELAGGLLLALLPALQQPASPGLVPTLSPDPMLPSPQVVAMYNLTLQVADMSGDGLTATTSAIITVEDINDNAPVFTRDEVPPLSPPPPAPATADLPSSGPAGRVGSWVLWGRSPAQAPQRP